MIQRNRFDDAIAVISSVTTAHPDIDDFQDSLAKLIGTRDCFDVKVMFVGHFNAGKSALLNRLIGRTDFLEEAQSPQTAIATELKYGDTESYFAYLDEGKGIQCIQMKTHTDFVPQQCDHIEYRLPIESLKILSDFTIVDMPGFDSGVVQHTKALDAYIGQGSAYLLIMDVADGEITQAGLKFLEEIVRYSTRIAIVLNKCDLGIEENNEKIRLQIEATLQDNGFSFPVIKTSKFDEDAASKLINLVGVFQAQEAFDEQMRRRLLAECVSIRNILQLTLDGLYMDTYTADKEIQKFENARQFLLDSLERQRKKFEDETAHQTQDIIDEIRVELLNKSLIIANAITIGGVNALEAVIVETVRPVVIEALRQSADEQLGAIIRSIDFSSILPGEKGASLGEIITNTANDIKSMIDNGTFINTLNTILPDEDKADNDSNDKKGGSKSIYRVVTGAAAIATDFIAPWLEVVIILLPDILNLFSNLLGENEQEKARRVFETAILPQITSRLYTPIDEAVQKGHAVLLEAMTTAATQKLEALQGTIQEAKNAKEAELSKFEEYKSSLQVQITALNNLEEKIQE